ncbi:hypothetical protein AQUCO_07400048v1 [Aquilegia coerulea]|uniref:Uncharacterized protein n=1 Tax=Aquilegia coerulea TaxID=218851 RepID=A0A2G5C9K6_AQUCA|nr:hypothetical protein AQUCO_07400048v1 [Aquilegia coerulea]PIA27939.1 hypothetical protein AQUCO_07400048v1 [Aquilegia coerulea]
MRAAKVCAFRRLYSLYPNFPTIFISCSSSLFPLSNVLNPIKSYLFCSSSSDSDPKDSTEVFRRCGCTDAEISKIFQRHPSLLNSNPTILSSKLTLLLGLGLSSSDLVRIIQCRPRILGCRIGGDLDERVDVLQSLFGSKEVFLKAIIRNPSLLTYDLHSQIIRCISLYEGLGISKKDLISLLISRPTLISRTSLNDEKLDCIRRSGVSINSNMYKHLVCIIAVSRLETIREKVANLEKFGFSGDQVMALFGRSPFLLTLSVDKVQRNMTFIIGTMKLPATVILQYSFLLFSNLELVLKPRYLVREKINDLGLIPQIKGDNLINAFRMKELRFLREFIMCHCREIANELMEFYMKAKNVKRLAETSRLGTCKGFPF